MKKAIFYPQITTKKIENQKLVNRTSPTNIGLGLLAVVASYDLGYENLEDTLKLLEKNAKHN